MIIRQFLEWFTVSAVDERVEAAQAFCNAYTQRVPEIINHPDSESVLTLILDDSSSCVRRVLAESLAGYEFAPRHIIVGLANESSDISIPVLGRSLLLTDADLIDCLAIGDDAAQSAIALRGDISMPISAAIAEVGCLNAVSLLLKNIGAVIFATSLARIAERFGHDLDIRELLLQRDDLPVATRYELVVNVSESLINFVNSCGWTEGARARRLISDVNEQATISLARLVGENQTFDLVETLRGKGHLTSSLLLRALLCGDVDLFEAALSVLTQDPVERVRNHLRQKSGASFIALYRRAKMPESLELAFKSAYLGAVDTFSSSYKKDRISLSRDIISKVLLSVAQIDDVENIKIMGLLRRLESDALRAEAKNISAQILGLSAPIEHDSGRSSVLIDYNAFERELFEQTENKNLPLQITSQCDDTDVLDLTSYKVAA
jgi:uncharacterized protein (DUF2336 family)